jgi:two-component system phosphate regulon sensor histidine kinase PhoR
MPPPPSGRRTRTLTGRLLLWQAVAVLAVLLALGVVVDRVLEDYFVRQLTDGLVANARAVQQALPPGATSEAEVIRLGRAIGVRITIIRTDGVVLADSEHDPATMQNHLNRPEVREALAGRIGEASHVSATLGIPFRYVALPPSNGRVVRAALPLTAVHSRLATVRNILVAGFGLAALAGLVVLALIARGLSRPIRRMTAAVERVGGGDLSTEVPEVGPGEIVTLAGTVNRMRGDVAFRIAAAERERTTRDTVLSALDEGVVLFDSAGAVAYRNASSDAMLGSLPNARTLYPIGLRDLVTEASTRAGGGAPAPAGEFGVGFASRTVSATAVAVPGQGVLLVLRDVTEARAVDAVRRDFVANASHELKTPAAAIRALAETISAALSDDPRSVPRFARQLEREAERLSRVVSDLLDLSRLEGGTLEPKEVRFDVTVAEETERLRERASADGLHLRLEADRPVTVSGSARDLGLLARNLVENALQYTRPGGRVEVVVSESRGEAVLVVKDTGAGIPARDQARIFERFYRVDRARSRDTGGTGLGLSIVKHVVENHGGIVTVDSVLGRGSTFTVRLPAAGDQA